MRLVKCENCAFCDEEKMICKPDSEHYKEHKLTKDDLIIMSRCDYFIPRENEKEKT